MPRLRFIDYRNSRAPKVLGFCNDDRRNLADYANSAQRRLIFAREAGDEGWWGTWAEIAFSNVSRTRPYITCPRSVARLEKLNVCTRPVPIQNQFYEYLDFGNGRLPKRCQRQAGWCSCNTQCLTRNNVISFADQTVSPCYIRAYTTNVSDTSGNYHVLIQGLDEGDNVVKSQVVEQIVDGEYLTLASPFVQSTNKFNRLTGFQKDPTIGDIQFFQVDPDTGDETLLLIMEAGETVSGYRRYYINSLPANCCGTSGPVQDVTVTAIAKMELIPVSVDTDYLLIQNLEALIEESISLRMSEMDNANAQQLAAIHHVNAVRMLNSEITHYLGKQIPAVNFAPFGSARLECQKIGIQI